MNALKYLALLPILVASAPASIALRVVGTVERVTPTHFVIRSDSTLISVRKADLKKEQIRRLSRLDKRVEVMLTPAQIQSVTETK